MTTQGATLMAEETTTDNVVEYSGSDAVLQDGIYINQETGNALTEEEVSALPDQSTDESTDLADDSNSTEQVRSESTSLDEDPNVQWASKRGLNLSDPADIAKLAKIARDNQRDFTRERQQVSSLDSALNQLDGYQQQNWQAPPAVDQYQQSQYDPSYSQQVDIRDNKMNLAMFASRHAQDVPAGSELDQEIGKVIAEDPTFWTSSNVHLERALKLAKSNLAESSIEDRLEQARREERDRLTRKSSLQSPSTQSTTKPQGTSITTPADAERFINTHSKAEIAERQDELERILGMELGPKKRY